MSNEIPVIYWIFFDNLNQNNPFMGADILNHVTESRSVIGR